MKHEYSKELEKPDFEPAMPDAEAKALNAELRSDIGPETPHETPETARPHAPVKAGKAVVLFSVAAVAIAVTGVFGRQHEEQRLSRWTDDQAVPTVATIAPQRGGQATELVLPGDVEAFYSASIHGQVSGYVSAWRRDIGAKVKQGDVLAVVDTPELDERVTEADGELAKAKANLALANVTAKRWDSLRSSAAVSQQAADEKESDSNAKEAEVQAARANLDRLKALKGFANIVAPFDGVVTARNVDIGSLVRADSNSSPPLFTVADIHKMRIYVRVPETYSAALKDGLKATLELPEYPNHPFEATVDTTSHAIDRRSRSLLVELIADNADGKLSPGAFTRVHFQLPANPDAIRVPASALLFRDSAVEVATLGLDNRIRLRKVRITRDFGSEVEIAGGLGPDERLVANPPESLDNGEEVRVMNAATDKEGPSGGQQGAQLDGARPKSSGELAETERGHGE